MTNYIKINNDVYTRTPVDLQQAEKISESSDYSKLFEEIFKIDNTLKTGTDIVNAFEERIDLPRNECIQLMVAYMSWKKKNL